MEREVVQARSEPVVAVAGERGGLLEYQIGRAEVPAATVLPALVEGVAEIFQEPLPVGDRTGEVGNPDLDMME
ncbi:hypothetical protein ASD29_00370 [Streptomyces sp. Root1295]|nr:hypothetical protein ASD29_00370 [Streptomyces sp. Root1295]